MILLPNYSKTSSLRQAFEWSGEMSHELGKEWSRQSLSQVPPVVACHLSLGAAVISSLGWAECPGGSFTGLQFMLIRVPTRDHSSRVISRAEFLTWQLAFSRATILRELGRSCIMSPDPTLRATHHHSCNITWATDKSLRLVQMQAKSWRPHVLKMSDSLWL